MSPIRPENLARYPADWPQISLRIRTVRSGGRCECKGECGRSHRGRCRAWNGQPHPVTGSKVVLTVAHLDHTPENCADDNLCAMCQACHLSYDADHHAATRARTRHEQQTTDMDPLFTAMTTPQTRRAKGPAPSPRADAPALTPPVVGAGAPSTGPAVTDARGAAGPGQTRTGLAAGAHAETRDGEEGKPSAPGSDLVITVLGKPAPQGSKRHVGGGRMIEQSKRVAPWREAVKTAAIAQNGLPRIEEKPVAIEAIFCFDKPKSAPKRRRTWPTTRASGDVDKVLRSTFDALCDAGVMRDDSQVIDVHAHKVFTDDPAAPLRIPGAVIRIWEIS